MIDCKGNIVPSSKFSPFYKKRANPKLSCYEFAKDWLNHFSKVYKSKEEVDKMSKDEKSKYIKSYESYTGPADGNN